MKKFIVVATVMGISSLLYAKGSNEHVALIKDYKMMFDRIGEKRIGAPEREIESVKPPFIRLTKEEVKQVVVKKDGTKVAVKKGYELQAIMNDRVKISGKWYKLGDKIDDFILATIKNNAVFLQSRTDEFKKRLTLREKNEKISIK